MTQQVPIPVNKLDGGISKQPPHVRFAGQVEDATNVVFDIADGMSRRPGTFWVTDVSGVVDGNDYRIHPIDVDGSEQYLAVYGKGSGATVLKLYNVDGTAVTLTVTAGQAYLDSGTPEASDLKLVTFADTTFVVNTKVTSTAKASSSFTVSYVWPDYDILTSFTPESGAGIIHQATGDTSQQVAGYWQYDPAPDISVAAEFAYQRYAITTLVANGAIPASYVDGSAFLSTDNSFGFAIGFQSFAINGATPLWTFTTAAKTLVVASGTPLANYVRRGFDKVHVTGGAAVTPGWYTIASKDSSTQLTLLKDIGGSDPADVTIDAIGNEFNIIVPEYATEPASMHVVAEAIEQEFRDQGGSDVLVAWEETAHEEGRFRISAPYRGTDTAPARAAKVFDPTAPVAVGGGVRDMTAAGTDPLGTVDSDQAGVVTLGSTDPDTLEPTRRWMRVAAPNQPDAELDATTMPLKLFRTSANNFTLDQIVWNPRGNGNEVTNPVPSIWISGGGTLSDIGLFRNRLVMSSGENIVFSQSDDLFNFYLADADNIVDADPVDLTLGSDQITNVEYLVPFRNSLLVFTEAGRQFEIGNNDPLTPSNAPITASTKYNTLKIRPKITGSLLHFAGKRKSSGILWEYFYDDLAVSFKAENITAHVVDLMSDDIQAMDVSASSGITVALAYNKVLPSDSTDKSTLYGYQSFWLDNRKEQSAWTKWTFAGTLLDIAIIRNNCFIIANATNTIYIERLPLVREEMPQWRTDVVGPQVIATWPYIVHVDGVQIKTGSFAAGDTTWTVDNANGKIDVVQFFDGSDMQTFDSSSTGWSASTTQIVVTGDYSASTAILGDKFTSSATLTRPYVRENGDGRADLAGRVMVKTVTTAHTSGTQQYALQRAQTGTTTNTRTYPTDTTNAIDTDRLRTTLMGDAATATWTITEATPQPFTISGVYYTAEYKPGGM